MDGLLQLLGGYTAQTVVAGAALLGVTAGVLGCFAVLREQSLLGDMLSHAALPGIALGFLVAGGRELGPILLGALATGVGAALVMLLLTRRSRLKTDAGLGIALSVSFALGTVLLSHIQNRSDAAQAGLESFLFGQAAAILRSDLALLAAVAVAALALVALLWKEFELLSFDRGFAASLGLPVVGLEVLLTTTIAVAVVIGLQLVGVVLMSAMVIAPAVAARQWTERLGRMVGLAALFGGVSGVAGALASAAGPGLATGPLIVLAATALVLVSLLFAPNRGLVRAAFDAQRDRRRLRRQQLLTTLYRLGQRHENPRYAAELGMLDLYHGTRTRDAMEELERAGWARPRQHMPEEGPHWELTPEGRREAERFLEALAPDGERR